MTEIFLFITVLLKIRISFPQNLFIVIFYLLFNLYMNVLYDHFFPVEIPMHCTFDTDSRLSWGRQWTDLCLGNCITHVSMPHQRLSVSLCV